MRYVAAPHALRHVQERPATPSAHVSRVYYKADQLFNSVESDQHARETHVSALLLAVLFLLLGWVAFAAGVSVKAIFLIAGILGLSLLVFLSGA